MSPTKLISGFCGAVLLLTIIIAAFPKRGAMMCVLIIEDDIQEEQNVEPTPLPDVEPEHE